MEELRKHRLVHHSDAGLFFVTFPPSIPPLSPTELVMLFARNPRHLWYQDKKTKDKTIPTSRAGDSFIARDSHRRSESSHTKE